MKKEWSKWSVVYFSDLKLLFITWLQSLFLIKDNSDLYKIFLVFDGSIISSINPALAAYSGPDIFLYSLT